MNKYTITIYDAPVDGKVVWAFNVDVESKNEAEYIGKAICEKGAKDNPGKYYCYAVKDAE